MARRGRDTTSFGIAPEAFDAIDMVPAHRTTLSFADYHMLPAQFQRGVSLSFVYVVERTLTGVRLDLLHHRGPVMRRDRHRFDPTIALHKIKDDHLSPAPSAPRSFFGPCMGKCRAIGLKRQQL